MTHTLYTHWQHTNTLLHFFIGGKSRPEPSHTPTRPPLKAADQDTALKLCVRVHYSKVFLLFISLSFPFLYFCHTHSNSSPALPHVMWNTIFMCSLRTHPAVSSGISKMPCLETREPHLCVWGYICSFEHHKQVLYILLSNKPFRSIITREPLEKEPNLIILGWQAASNFSKRPKKAGNAPSYMTINYDGARGEREQRNTALSSFWQDIQLKLRLSRCWFTKRKV